MKKIIHKWIHYVQLGAFQLKNSREKRFDCPICGYRGPFKTVRPPTGLRKHASCPNCGSMERHRLQYLVLDNLMDQVDFSAARMLHFAPESFFRGWFADRVGNYETADLLAPNVDYQVDLQHLPFEECSYDLIYASHVLEHIPDDNKALSEIARILKPGGIAILPVPVVCEKTIEYPEPNPNETEHVRAPGVDYYKRYEKFFSRVDVADSSDMNECHQTWIYEDRASMPNDHMPHRTPMFGERHPDYVPVCYL